MWYIVDVADGGGIAFAVANEVYLPVLFVATGEVLEDLAEFDPELFVEGLFSEAGGKESRHTRAGAL